MAVKMAFAAFVGGFLIFCKKGLILAEVRGRIENADKEVIFGSFSVEVKI